MGAGAYILIASVAGRFQTGTPHSGCKTISQPQELEPAKLLTSKTRTGPTVFDWADLRVKTWIPGGWVLRLAITYRGVKLIIYY